MIVAQIENAMGARLNAASKLGVLGYSLRAVESLPTDLDEFLSAEIRDFPAAWTVFGGWRKLNDMGGGEVLVEGTFHLVVGASNLRNEKAQRHGGAPGEIGSYQLALDLPALLVAQDFGLPISALKLGACTPLYTGGDRKKRPVSLFAIAFTSEFMLSPRAPAEITVPPIGDFTTFAAGWDIPPHDGQADASSLITFPAEEP